MKSVDLASVTVAFQVHRMPLKLSEREPTVVSFKVFTDSTYFPYSFCLLVTTV